MTFYKKIIAVIVTYNRCELLKRCINNIKKQSFTPQEILVVNNGSEDNTVSMLSGLNIKSINQDNIGSAGGWATGIEYAIKNGFDAIWLMDDDGYPDRFSLENLLKASDKNTSCVSSILVKENNIEEFVFPYPVINKENKPALFSLPRKFSNKKDLLTNSKQNKYPFAHLFNGALISLKAVKKIGNVNKNYFIYGDELDYYYRLLEAGNVYSVLDCLHYHPDVNKRKYNLRKIYFVLKNTLIINKKYYRNYLLRQLLQIINILIIVIRRNGFIYFIKLLFGKNFKLVPLAILRGLKGNIGNDYYE